MSWPRVDAAPDWAGGGSEATGPPNPLTDSTGPRTAESKTRSCLLTPRESPQGGGHQSHLHPPRPSPLQSTSEEAGFHNGIIKALFVTAKTRNNLSFSQGPLYTFHGINKENVFMSSSRMFSKI